MFRNTFRFLSVLTFVALAVTVAPACATTIQTYTSLASWQAASSGVTLINFEDGNLNDFGVQFLGINGTIGVIDTSPNSWMNYNTGKAAFIVLNNSNFFPFIRIILPSPVTAFALNVFSANPNALSFMITLNSISNTVTTFATPTPAFFGVTSDTAFTTIDLTLQGTAGNSAAYELIDNVSFGTAQDAQAPEAATFLLIGSGLVGLMAVRKRIMKNKPDLRPLQNNPVLSSC